MLDKSNDKGRQFTLLRVLQLTLYCALFTLMVRYAVRGGAIDGLYFYPKAVQDRAIEIGLKATSQGMK